jgi:hypothetical protein
MKLSLLVLVALAVSLFTGHLLKCAGCLGPRRTPARAAVAASTPPVPAHYRLCQPRHWRACMLQQR